MLIQNDIFCVFLPKVTKVWCNMKKVKVFMCWYFETNELVLVTSIKKLLQKINNLNLKFKVVYIRLVHLPIPSL